MAFLKALGLPRYNNLIPDAVLVPSVVAFLVELQRAGFPYVKAVREEPPNGMAQDV